LALIVAASPAWAWGDLGHRVICQIAFQELNDRARNEFIRLIALDETFNSVTHACTWPDHPRKQAEEHFVNVGRSVHTITVSECPAVPKCLFTAIATDLEVLRTSNDDAAKLASLKYLAHWIGDIRTSSRLACLASLEEACGDSDGVADADLGGRPFDEFPRVAEAFSCAGCTLPLALALDR
jgi:hypothetical protein